MTPARLSVQAAADILQDRQLLLTPLWLIKSINDSNSCVFFFFWFKGLGHSFMSSQCSKFHPIMCSFFFFFAPREKQIAARGLESWSAITHPQTYCSALFKVEESGIWTVTSRWPFEIWHTSAKYHKMPWGLPLTSTTALNFRSDRFLTVLTARPHTCRLVWRLSI